MATLHWKQSFLGVLTATALALTACTSNSDESVNSGENTTQADSSSSSASSHASETKTFVDQVGHEIELETPVSSIAVMQHHSLDILAQLGAQDKVTAVESKWQSHLGDYIKEQYPDIEKLPNPGDLESLSVEDIAELKPDLVITASQANENDLKKLDDLGIKHMTVSLRAEGKQKEAQNPQLADSDKAYTDGLEWAIKTLGEVTGTEERADKLWDFAVESRKHVEDQVGDIPDEERTRVFIANEGMQTYGNDKYVGAQLLRAGAINVAAEDIQGYKQYSMEQVLDWDPDVIIVQDRYKDVYDDIMSSSEWQTVRAVREGNVILAPSWTKPWGNPGPDSLALGEPWLAHKFYPDRISVDYVQQRAEDFYETFYEKPFTDTVD